MEAEPAGDNYMKMKSALSELEGLLSEDIVSAKHREKNAFDELAGPLADSIVLHGAGNLGRKTLHGLRRAGVEPVAFSDNNAELWGKTLDGVPVFSPFDAARKFGKSAVFVVTIWGGAITDTMADRCRPLLELGCAKVLNFGLLFWKYPEIFGPHYSYDLPHKLLEQGDQVRRAFDLWADDASRSEYVSHVRWRLKMDFDGMPRPVRHPMYFPDDIVEVSNDEVFVDCGAYDGDTLKTFLEKCGGNFSEFHALEADPKNASKLRAFIATLPADLQRKITTHELAVGAMHGKVLFDAFGTASSAVGRGSLEIKCAPLDEILASSQPTWIKMDIEGSEPDALVGATSLFLENSPVLAICVYHSQSHIWSIPLQMNSLIKNYSFFLRPHVFESWDLVCYAIPNRRLL
jgi:FkbM family methyltransferase